MSLLTLLSWFNGVVQPILSSRVKARFAVRRAQVARLTGCAALRAASQYRPAISARLTVRGDDRL